MRRFFLISSAALSMHAVGCTTGTPQAVCAEGVRNSCARFFECTSEQVKSSDDFKSNYGTSIVDCERKLMDVSRCNEWKDFDELCVEGKTYDVARASECTEKVMAQSCADFNDTTKRPAVCSQICH